MSYPFSAQLQTGHSGGEGFRLLQHISHTNWYQECPVCPFFWYYTFRAKRGKKVFSSGENAVGGKLKTLLPHAVWTQSEKSELFKSQSLLKHTIMSWFGIPVLNFIFHFMYFGSEEGRWHGRA